jgi:hypothetical protein
VLQPTDTRTLNQKKSGFPVQQHQHQQQQSPSKSVAQLSLPAVQPVVRPAFDFATLVYGDELQQLQQQQQQHHQGHPEQQQAQHHKDLLSIEDDDFGGFQDAVPAAASVSDLIEDVTAATAAPLTSPLITIQTASHPDMFSLAAESHNYTQQHQQEQATLALPQDDPGDLPPNWEKRYEPTSKRWCDRYFCARLVFDFEALVVGITRTF